MRPVSRRDVLAGLGAGGLLLATGSLAACSRAPTSGGDGASVPALPFAQPDELVSREGHLAVKLTAAPTRIAYGNGSRWALTYNGSSPGPTLRVRPGDLVEVTLDNQLDEPTNLHTHGLHVSPDGDSDNVFVMVEPSQHHTYRYRIPTDHPSGTFWYHPHHHGKVARQVFGGLAGAIIVEDDLDRLAALAAATERVLVLSDSNIGDNASILEASMMQRMLGREGTTVLVNGRAQPRLGAMTGTLEHWRIINASPSRYYALRLDGQPFHLIATDGGRLPAPDAIDELVLVPGERAEVLVPLDRPGTHDLITRTVDRGGMGMAGSGGMGPNARRNPPASATIATLHVDGPKSDAPPLPASLRPAGVTAGPVDHARELTLSMAMGMAGTGGDGQFRIDGRSFDPTRIDIETRLGTTEEWTVRNTSTMDHPFHLHVWPFQVVDRSDGHGVTSAWKDTVNVPAGHWVRIRIPFRDFPGSAVYHCHILDHEDLGMMGVISVRPAD